jgi:hypothetical protein
MTVKLLTTLCGPEGTRHPGTHTLSPALEKALLDGGYAMPVKQEGQAESARRRTPENAARQHVPRTQR